MANNFRLPALLSFALLTGAAAAQPPDLPNMKVVLTPISSGDEIERLGVDYTIESPDIEKGAPLLQMPTTLVSTPTAALTTDDLNITDERGPVPVTQQDLDPTPSGVYRQWTANRATVGDVSVSYEVTPREVNSETRNGPLFDLRAEAGGVLGAGVYFYALPPIPDPHQISLSWDLSEQPEGARGIWSFGEGDVERIAPPETLRFTFYAAGPVNSLPTDGDGNFVMYWLTEPPFDIEDVATQTKAAFTYMADFFDDPGDPYRVFVRQNPYPGGGGTALPQSFTYSYGNDGQTGGAGTVLLLAHEITHKWPTLTGPEPHAETSWYTEGTAQYYSTLLLLRAGIISSADYLSAVNKFAAEYYTNPHRTKTNAAAGDAYWQDARAQQVPYGRGFMYFAATDAKLRAVSGGETTLDDLVLEMLERQRAGEQMGVKEWQTLIERELGTDGLNDYADMVRGRMIVPPADSLGPCFTAEETTVRRFELGFDRMRLGVVKYLVEESPAAEAGLAEDDTILSMTPLKLVQDDPGAAISIRVMRDGEELDYDFVPRGAPTQAWQWSRVKDVEDAACAF